MTDAFKLVPVELRPDRKLIDANFDSYKLSLNTLPSYKGSVTDGVFRVTPSDSDIVYEKIRCLTLHNYLTLDPWNQTDVYYVDSHGSIKRYHVPFETHIEPPKMVFSLGSDVGRRKKLLPPSLVFASSSLCVVCDGFGTIFLLDTGLRSEQRDKLWSIQFLVEDVSYQSMVLSAIYRDVKERDMVFQYVDCLILKFIEPPRHSDNPTKIRLEWLTLVKTSEQDEFSICELKLFEGKSVPTYAALSPDASNMHVSASAPFNYKPAWDTEDDEEIESLSEAEDVEVAKEAQKPPYKWTQNTEDVIIYVDLPPGTPSSAIAYSLSTKHLSLAIREAKDAEPKVILKGDLYLDADPESSSWIIENNRLEVTLQKRTEDRSWLTVVEGDDRGEYEADPEEAAKVHQQLAHLTSETVNTDSSEGALFNSGQLEDCDSYYDATATLVRFDTAINKFTHIADISSYRWLFDYSIGPGEFPVIVLRHDVDAVAWQPTLGNLPASKDKRLIWRHISTFNALGYVHASKTNLKFCSSPPDASYAAFCECQHRIYIYRQPTPLGTSLRNRSSGVVVGKIAVQQVATIEGNEDILGFAVTNERIYILTLNDLIIFKVHVDDGA